jgi:2-methylcitrate dehydratase
MILHDVRVHPSKDNLKREDQLAWKIAAVAADKVAVDKDVTEMIVNRIIDNAAVAIAAINRRPVVSARDMALGTAQGGATVFGVAAAKRVSPEWAAWANGTAVRELDMHDTFLAADYSHPGDNIPPILAVAQTMGKVRPRSDPRHRHRLRNPDQPGARDLAARAQDRPHRASLPGAGGGIGTLLGLKQEVIYQAVQQAVHVSFTTRQSRKGEISSWKAYAPRMPASWRSRRSIA